MLLPSLRLAASANTTLPSLFTVLALGQATTGVQLLARTEHDEVPLVFELLSERACPASVLFLLRSQAVGLVSASGVALALAATPAEERLRSSLPLALVGAAAARIRQPQLSPTRGTVAAGLRYGMLLCACAAHQRASPPRGLARAARPRRSPRQRALEAAGRTALGVGVAALAFPSACAGTAFACMGEARPLLARALRCAAGGLLPLGAGCLELSRQPAAGASAPTKPPRPGGGAPAAGDGPKQRRRGRLLLAVSVAAGCAAQLALLLGPHAHALHRWARGALVLLHSATATVAARHV